MSALPQTYHIIEEYQVLWTAQKHQKSKRWQDGKLRLHTFNNRLFLTDETGSLVADKYHLSNTKPRYDNNNPKGSLNDDEDIEFEAHIVTVQDFLGWRKGEVNLRPIEEARKKKREEIGRRAQLEQAGSAARMQMQTPVRNMPSSARSTPLMARRGATAAYTPVRPQTATVGSRVYPQPRQPVSAAPPTPLNLPPRRESTGAVSSCRNYAAPVSRKRSPEEAFQERPTPRQQARPSVQTTDRSSSPAPPSTFERMRQNAPPRHQNVAASHTTQTPRTMPAQQQPQLHNRPQAPANQARPTPSAREVLTPIPQPKTAPQPISLEEDYFTPTPSPESPERRPPILPEKAQEAQKAQPAHNPRFAKPADSKRQRTDNNAHQRKMQAKAPPPPKVIPKPVEADENYFSPSPELEAPKLPAQEPKRATAASKQSKGPRFAKPADLKRKREEAAAKESEARKQKVPPVNPINQDVDKEEALFSPSPDSGCLGFSGKESVVTTAANKQQKGPRFAKPAELRRKRAETAAKESQPGKQTPREDTLSDSRTRPVEPEENFFSPSPSPEPAQPRSPTSPADDVLAAGTNKKKTAPASSVEIPTQMLESRLNAGSKTTEAVPIKSKTPPETVDIQQLPSRTAMPKQSLADSNRGSNVAVPRKLPDPVEIPSSPEERIPNSPESQVQVPSSQADQPPKSPEIFDIGPTQDDPTPLATLGPAPPKWGNGPRAPIKSAPAPPEPVYKIRLPPAVLGGSKPKMLSLGSLQKRFRAPEAAEPIIESTPRIESSPEPPARGNSFTSAAGTSWGQKRVKTGPQGRAAVSRENSGARSKQKAKMRTDVIEDFDIDDWSDDGLGF